MTLHSVRMTEKLGARMPNQGLGPVTVEKHDDEEGSWRKDSDERTPKTFTHAHG